MVKPKKNPWAVAILNFLLPGLGYVYVGKRVGFGIGLIISSIILLPSVILTEMPPIIWLDGLIMCILFAYDGYKTAEEVNKRE